MQPIHQFHNWVSQPRMLPQWEQRLRSPHPSICDDGRMFSISIVAKYRKVAFEIVWYSVSYSKYSKLCALWMPHGWIGAKKSRAYEDIWSWIVMCLAFGCLWSVRTSMQSSTTKCCRFPILDITEIPAAGNTTSSRHWKSDRWRGDSCKAVSMTRWPTYYDKTSTKNLRTLPHQQPRHLQGRTLAGCPANPLPGLVWTYVWELSTKLGQNLHDWIHGVRTK